MHRPEIVRLAVLLLALVLPAPRVHAGDEGDARIEELERRVEVLEAERNGGRGSFSSWTDRIQISGSADTGYFGGSPNSIWYDKAFQVWDARFFIDAELGGPVRLFGKDLVRNIGFSFEWNLVRIGFLANDVGDLYVDLQGIADSSWLNLQVGRFQIPVGEAYLRYGQGYAYKPFVSNAAAGPWYWDEGLKLYGSSSDGLFSYVASISNNETVLNDDSNGELQYTLKLMTEPTDWLRLSVSGLYGGTVDAVAGSFMSGSALWLGEMWARPFGSWTAVPSYWLGVPVPDGPQRIDQTWYVGGDVILSFAKGLDVWLSYGVYDIDQGSAIWSRFLHTFVAEVVLHGGLVSAELDPFYLGVRATGLGTWNDGLGYLYDFRQSDIGYDMESLVDYSVVLGWHLIEFATLRVEYTRRAIALVDGAPASIRSVASDQNQFAVELGVYF